MIPVWLVFGCRLAVVAVRLLVLSWLIGGWLLMGSAAWLMAGVLSGGGLL